MKKRNKKNALRGICLQFFAMRNLDAIQQDRTEILQRMTEAVQANDQEKFAQAFGDLADAIEKNIMKEVHAVQTSQDNSILAARGCRVLTSEERQYYEAVIGALKSENPKQALTNVNKVMPETIINAVFDDLASNHPLLSAINFQNTGALVKILLSTSGGAAKWGTISKAVTEELSADFIEVDLTLAALTAFLPVNRYMLDLGPEWMDRYVRELLSEALAVDLETGIIAGNGKDAPIGMMKKLTGAVDGVYSDKDAVAVTDLSPTTYGKVLATLSVGPNQKTRAVTEVLLVVNPMDYFTYIELLGKQYPMCFSLTAATEMDEAFGGLESLAEQLQTGGVGKVARTVNTALEILLKAGRNYAALNGMEVPDPLPCAPADLIDVSDGTVVKSIFSAISKDTEREVETVPKNGEAAQGL